MKKCEHLRTTIVVLARGQKATKCLDCQKVLHIEWSNKGDRKYYS